MVYSVLSREASTKQLQACLDQEFVLLSDGGEPCQAACHQATTILRDDADVAAVVFCPEGPVSSHGEVGDAVPVNGIFCRSNRVRSLIGKGFKPLVDWGELDCALRHAGWRLRALPSPLTTPKTGSFSDGRREFARGLYDLALEQMLAGGPRVLKRTFLYHLWCTRARFQKSRSLKKEAGYLFQSILSILLRQRIRLLEGRWRETKLNFRFPRSEGSTAVLLFTANRPWYLRRSLRALHTHWPLEKPPLLVISQDGYESTTTHLVRSLGHQVQQIHFDQPVHVPLDALMKGHTPYCRITQHYKYSVDRVFLNPTVKRLIILEDDIEVGADFFPFMARFADELDGRDDLLAVSAWNDHGQYASCPNTIHRTDCFPGYGWMITRRAWETLQPDWPYTLWDEWLRRADVLKGRQFLRPEISRVRNFGRSGTSSANFYDTFIAPVRTQKTALPWESPVPALNRRGYRKVLWSQIRQAMEIRHPRELSGQDCAIVYRSEQEFELLAKELGLVPTYHELGPRAAFEGIVVLRIQEAQLFLVRHDTWEELTKAMSP